MKRRLAGRPLYPGTGSGRDGVASAPAPSDGNGPGLRKLEPKAVRLSKVEGLSMTESRPLGVQGETEAQRGRCTHPGRDSAPGSVSRGGGPLAAGHSPLWASVSPSVRGGALAARVGGVRRVRGPSWRPQHPPSLFGQRSGGGQRRAASAGAEAAAWQLVSFRCSFCVVGGALRVRVPAP